MNRSTKLGFWILVMATMLNACGGSGGGTTPSVASDVEINPILCEDLPNSNLVMVVDDYQVLAGSSDYNLYLEDILSAAVPTETMASEHLQALDSFLTRVNNYFSYSSADGVLPLSAENPLDWVESLLIQQGPTSEFKQAVEQIISSIQAGESGCNYAYKSNLELVDMAGNSLYAGELSLFYSKFSAQVFLSIILADESADLENSITRSGAPYIGFGFYNAEDFVLSGGEALIRQAIANNQMLTESVFIDDGYDNKLGQISIVTRNAFCEDELECPDGTPTRVVQKEQCQGLNTGDDNEVNRIAVKSFDLSEQLKDLKRARIETDYANQEVRLYTSQYREAVFDSDGVTLIFDPSQCETQAILDELSELNPDQGVSLTAFSDPGYDIEYERDSSGERVLDSEGEPIVIVPTPTLIYQGTLIPDRL